MRTKDELFRAAQREVSARRQQAVMQAETARRAAYAAHPALAAADEAHMRAGLGCLPPPWAATWTPPAPR